MNKLYGVITAMTTPFTANNMVDVASLEAQTEFLIRKRVNCLYPCGTTGEMYLMNSEERKLVAKTVVRKAAKRVLVYIHCGAMKQEDTIDLIKNAYEIGADGVGVVTPSYFTLDDRAMIEYYKTISSCVPNNFPIYVYVIPQLAKNDVTPDCMEKIAEECPNIVGVKYSFGDIRRAMQYKRIRGGAFSVVLGADDLFLPGLMCGFDGTVSGCSGPFPEPFIAIWDAFNHGDFDRAREAQTFANEIVSFLRHGADMSLFKNILTLRGVAGGHMRKPLLDLDSNQIIELKQNVSRYLTSVNSLG